ncbi:ABC transporter permease [Yinghuangia sp. ASG 101]|uniref:ABC transporter permease n=1 Tax=Yinghuangia sp. ASG 101 TaxID=2896848 RepID=UPI001E301D4E|nr:ABC transporter permease [Yinghuangia sp. ASG 101]UGQ12106.1 ABC transporter permease [Yinghuangia sp. ASG 101]
MSAVDVSSAAPAETGAAAGPAARGGGGPLSAVLRDRQVRVGGAVTLLVVLIALVGPYAAPHATDALVGATYDAPGADTPLGTDYLGHDVLSRVLSGGRSVVLMTVSAAALALIAGTALGVAAAFAAGFGPGRRGRALDRVLTWIADVLLAFPNVVMVLLVVAMFGRERWLMVATVALTLLPGTLRLARASAIGVIHQEFVQAARLTGYPKRELVTREVLPNIAAPLLVHLGTMLTWAVELLAGMAFLGYGVTAPAADWGLMINENRGGLRLQPWGVVVPVLLIAAFALGTNAMAEGAARATGEGGARRAARRSAWRRPGTGRTASGNTDGTTNTVKANGKERAA